MKISVLCVFLIALLAMLVAETSAAKFRTAKTTAVSTSEDHGLAETSGSAEVDEDDALVETAANDDDDDALVETEQEQRVTGGRRRRRRRRRRKGRRPSGGSRRRRSQRRRTQRRSKRRSYLGGWRLTPALTRSVHGRR